MTDMKSTQTTNSELLAELKQQMDKILKEFNGMLEKLESATKNDKKK